MESLLSRSFSEVSMFHFKPFGDATQSPVEQQQIDSIAEFKTRIGNYTFYKIIDAFSKEVLREDLLKIIENYSELSRPPIDAAFPTDYIPRKIIKNSDLLISEQGRQTGQPLQKTFIDILMLLQAERCLVLTGAAGMGKTFELRRVNAHFAQNGLFYPVWVSLNKYTGGDIYRLISLSHKS